MLETVVLKKIEDIALKAGKAILEIYNKDFSVNYKKDNTPLTQADIVSNEIISMALQELFPHIPIMSEENKQVPYEERKDWKYYWCIDPIDGTKEFVNKNGEFTVNIALIYKQSPVLGVVYAPVIDELYSAKKDEGAFLNGLRLPLHVNKKLDKNIKIVASKSHLSPETQEFINSLDTEHIEQISKGSSLKLCMVASGEADIYPRLGPTMEWDTAAADAVVREAGKMCLQFKTTEPILYNKENLLNPWFIVS